MMTDQHNQSPACRKRKLDQRTNKPANKRETEALDDPFSLSDHSDIPNTKRRKYHGGDDPTDPIVIGSVIPSDVDGSIFTVSDNSDDEKKNDSSSVQSIDEENWQQHTSENSTGDKTARTGLQKSFQQFLYDTDDENDNEGIEFDSIVRTVALEEDVGGSPDSQPSLPDLNLSQLSASTDPPETPISSQPDFSSRVLADFWDKNASGSPATLREDTNTEAANKDKAALLALKKEEIRKRRKETKRLLIYECLSDCRDDLQRRVDSYINDLPSGRKNNECWLYSGPRLPNSYCHRTIRVTANFRHEGRSRNISLNIGLISLLLEGSMTAEQKEGIIEEDWNASHLCGNWTCLNTRHIYPESLRININRNPCFAKVDGPCKHTPRCLKHLKVEQHVLRPTPSSSQLSQSVERLESSQDEFGDSFEKTLTSSREAGI